MLIIAKNELIQIPLLAQTSSGVNSIKNTIIPTRSAKYEQIVTAKCSAKSPDFVAVTMSN